MLESRDTFLCDSFANYVDGADKKLFQKAIKLIEKEESAKRKEEEKRKRERLKAELEEDKKLL